MGLTILETYWENEGCGSITGSNLTVLSKGLEGMGGFSLVGDFDKDIEFANSILEIGPGHGHAAKDIETKYPEKKLYLADISKRVLDNITIVADKYKLLDLPKDIVDVAYTHLVVQHVPKHLVEQFFKIIYDALKLNGKFYFQYLMSKQEQQEQVWQGGTILHSDTELVNSLEKVNFKVNSIAKIPIKDIYWWGYCCAIKEKGV